MVYNRRDLKVVSMIIQLVMTAMFLILGLADLFQVR